MIDLHCHALPGIDDGPATMEDALELAREQDRLGVRMVVATPHVSWDFPDVTAARIAAGVAELNDRLAREDIAMRVVVGAEVALTRALEMADDELAALRLGGGPWLLIEPPHSPAAGPGTEAALVSLLHRGHRLVIAHPERCPAFLADRSGLERLVGAGALCSLTASSLTGRFGRDVRRFAVDLVDRGLVHNVASDAHGPALGRRPGLADHVEQAGYGPLADWLCRATPAAILEGAAVPPRPAMDPPRRGALTRLLRRA